MTIEVVAFVADDVGQSRRSGRRGAKPRRQGLVNAMWLIYEKSLLKTMCIQY